MKKETRARPRTDLVQTFDFFGWIDDFLAFATHFIQAGRHVRSEKEETKKKKKKKRDEQSRTD